MVVRPVKGGTRTSFLYDEHAEVVAAPLYPITAGVFFLTEIEFVADGTYTFVGPYLPVAIGDVAFLADVEYIDRRAVEEQVHKTAPAYHGTVAVGHAGGSIEPQRPALALLAIYNTVYRRAVPVVIERLHAACGQLPVSVTELDRQRRTPFIVG